MSRTVLITGAGSGFGRGAALELARRGHKVIAAVLNDEQKAELAKAEPKLTVVKLDITKPADVAQVDQWDPDVFIANVVKHRPPGNRDPEPDEIAACAAFLDRQIAALNPLVIVTLGRYSMAKFFPNAKISAIHGQARLVNGRLVVAMFHPAAALHQPRFRDLIVADFKKLPQFIAEAASFRQEKPEIDPDNAQQLSLF